MLEVKVNVAEIKSFINEIVGVPGKLFELIRHDVKEGVSKYLTYLINSELTMHIGRERYEHKQVKEVNYRNGSYHRKFTLKGIGEIGIEVPRDRQGSFKSQVIPKSKQYEDKIREDLGLMFLTGVSTRSLSLITKRLLGRSLSHSEVSKAGESLNEAIEEWRGRDLSEELIKYMYLDGVIFPMRIAGKIEKVPVLVAIGVTEGQQKRVLGFQTGDKESSSNWREFMKDLKGRGLQGSGVILGIMDGLPGLEKVFKEEFPNARTQRCQVHVAKNVLAKVTRKQQQEVGDDLRSIFYASTKVKSLEFYKEFNKKWKSDFPSAVKSLETTIESCLTFFDFPEQEWISLRTTNVIERLNKEFKRRTKPMEILAGEKSCYRILAFVSLKMELHWRSAPVGKVNANLPFYSKLLEREFTQKS